MSKCGTAKVLEFDVFEKTPQGFNRVEFRGVRGQANQPEPLLGFLGEETLDFSTTVSGQAVPDEQQFAGDVVQPVTQKKAPVLTFDRNALAPRYTAYRVG